jgi:hypothetical protein
LQRRVRDLIIPTLRLELDVHSEALCRDHDVLAESCWRVSADKIVLQYNALRGSVCRDCRVWYVSIWRDVAFTW